MTKTLFMALVGVLAAGTAITLYPSFFPKSEPQTGPDTSVSNADDAAVRALVTEFASKFKNVALLASDRSAQIQKEYAPYVIPELLNDWVSKKTEAPGRKTSSPWPDRIDIVEVGQVSDGIYAVNGNVIEATSADKPNEPAGVQPMDFTVVQMGNDWKISGVTQGAYSDLPQRTELVGYWECLPHKDRTGPQTEECALGIALDLSDAHYAVDTRLMSTYPVDFSTGTKVRVVGIVTPANQLSSIQKYDIDGIISATSITKY